MVATNGKTAATTPADSNPKGEIVTIPPANFQTRTFRIRGTAPYVQNRFAEKAQEAMRETQAAGSTAKKGTKRQPKDFDAMFEGAKHVSEEGWYGIPAPAFRNGLISACRTVGFTMTRAKLAVFVDPDGIDRVDATPLVKITEGEPEKFESMGRNANGVFDIRVRPKWAIGWEAHVTLKWDADMFTLGDVVNLLDRMGQQVGIGEGRPDSRASAGQGWGMFVVLSDE